MVAAGAILLYFIQYILQFQVADKVGKLGKHEFYIFFIGSVFFTYFIYIFPLIGYLKSEKTKFPYIFTGYICCTTLLGFVLALSFHELKVFMILLIASLLCAVLVGVNSYKKILKEVGPHSRPSIRRG